MNALGTTFFFLTLAAFAASKVHKLDSSILPAVIDSAADVLDSAADVLDSAADVVDSAVIDSAVIQVDSSVLGAAVSVVGPDAVENQLEALVDSATSHPDRVPQDLDVQVDPPTDLPPAGDGKKYVCVSKTEDGTENPVVVCNLVDADFVVDSSMEILGDKKITFDSYLRDSKNETAQQLADHLDSGADNIGDKVVNYLNDQGDWLYQNIFSYLVKHTHDQVQSEFTSVQKSLEDQADDYLAYVKKCRVAELDAAIARETERSQQIVDAIKDVQEKLKKEVINTEGKISSAESNVNAQFDKHSQKVLASTAIFEANSKEIHQIAKSIVDKFQAEQRLKVNKKVEQILKAHATNVETVVHNTETSFDGDVSGYVNSVQGVVNKLITTVKGINGWPLITFENSV